MKKAPPLLALLALLVPPFLVAADAYRPPSPGLLYYAKADFTGPEKTRNVIANPFISGAFFQVIWSEVEKEDGKCDWSELDQWMKPWLDAGKKVGIRMMWSTSGYWRKAFQKTPTPRWVWEKGAVYALHRPSGTEIPLIWDPIYKKYAWRFMEQFAARYDANPALLFIDVTPGAETNPYRFGTINRVDPGFKDAYEKIRASDGRSYSEELWHAEVFEWMDAAGRIFKHTRPLVTLNVGSLRGADRAVVNGEQAVARGFHAGQNGFKATSFSNAEGGRTPAFLRWAVRTGTFFEMVAASGGETGPLMGVMEAAGRSRLLYLNVYPQDVLKGSRGEANFDPAYEAALKFGAEVIRRNHPPAEKPKT